MISRLIENKLPKNIFEKEFAAIIGLSPSKNARSPILWNKVYRNLNIPIRMVSFDCKKNNIKKLFNELKKNINFIGGAVTNPYKTIISDLLAEQQSIASNLCSAVNCLYRNKNGSLYGDNTDGDAALKSLSFKFRNLKKKNFFIIGTGATANTLISYLITKFKNKHKICVFGRNAKKLANIKSKYKVKIDRFFNIEKKLKRNSIIINCTSIGWGDQIKKSTIKEEDFKILKKLKCGYFDLIYDPDITIAIKYAKKSKINYINGKKMNIDQASIAFLKVNKNLKLKNSKVYKLMKDN